jgi:serine/threonine protein phosphatase PrpC
MRCPSPTCGAENPPEQNFCDECGAQLQADAPTPVEPGASQLAPGLVVDAQPCSQCGAGPQVIDFEGFCECGLMRIQPARNRVEILISAALAAVCDVGCNPLHPENQDFVAAGAEGEAKVGAVCDGVSCSQNSAAASEKAAPACRDVLLAGVGQTVDTQVLMRNAIRAANEAVLTVPYSPQEELDPPAATIVAALVQARKVTLGWVGDSRAYFIADNGTVYQLSVDHSYMTLLVESGVSPAKALQHKDAHAITRSLGGGSGGDSQEPTVRVFNAPGPGFILLCSDGLWNYVPEPKDMAGVFSTLSKAATAVQRAKALVEYARLRGGADNISVILIAIA